MTEKFLLYYGRIEIIKAEIIAMQVQIEEDRRLEHRHGQPTYTAQDIFAKAQEIQDALNDMFRTPPEKVPVDLMQS